MSDFSDPNPNAPIHISREDATSSHVDDMLRRQMSLRGETGITRDRRRSWYFQNWFIFMIAGIIGAVAAWAIIEPHFDDEIFFQGKIKTSEPTDFDSKDNPIIGTITIGDQTIHIARKAIEWKDEQPGAPVKMEDLTVGREVGVYLEPLPQTVKDNRTIEAIGLFVTYSPPPQASATAGMSYLERLKSSGTSALLLFPLVAGMVGLLIGAADGCICRLPRRAILGGFVGFLAGFVGGFVSTFVANMAYAPLTEMATENRGANGELTTIGFVTQMAGRTIGWALAGLAMGLGQGLALRSTRLLIYGLLGGVIGGILGGLAFDPIDLLLLGTDKPSAHVSRLVGFALVGASVGAMIGIVELLARDAWLRMIEGPLAGKEFLLFKDSMRLGASPSSDIYLFNDPAVAGHHATLRAVGDECEIESAQRQQQVLVNNRPVDRTRLRHGDRITLGRTSFVYEKRQG